MIERLVLFGATGDLVGRFLLPALASLHAAGRLPEGFQVVAAARRDLDDERFRQVAAKALEEHCEGVAPEARQAVVRSLHYRQADVADRHAVAAAISGQGEPVAVYLALPPGAFPGAVRALGAVELAAGSRVALENPFGEDLESAVALNRLLAEVWGAAAEQRVFRVDHVLGMATVQNLLAMRLANPVLEAVWSSAHVDQVEILWEETLALEGRAAYYDRTGALKDVLQTHMLQVLCLLAMEPPAGLGERELRDRKVEVLRSVRPVANGRTRRARYTAGHLAGPPEGTGQAVPAYADEEGVDPKRCTETFAAIELELEGERWSGTRFLLRAGKALSRRRKMVVVRFRGNASNELRIGLDGPEDITLHLRGGMPSKPAPLTLTAPPPASDLPAYGRVLLDVLSGGSELSLRGDEAEQAWRVVTPVLDAWADGAVPLREYPAGSPAAHQV
jgi:glucose-6-phosphate 1-dehydrogenase